MTTALLIIDVQHLLCVGEYECFEIKRVIDLINGLSARARMAGIPVILIQHEEKGSLLQQGGEGWQLAQALETSPQDLRVRKTSRDSFYQTRLLQMLQQWDVERVIICGLQTDYCVNATVRQALKLGYDVVLAADAHSTVDTDNMAADDIIAEHNTRLARLSSPVSRIDVIPTREIRIRNRKSRSARSGMY
ncbi:cysteine hydrolase family protein [Pseudomonas silesiensis]|uniref:Isochorismatase n=1 Tax=Pseudomonas silesiensis TaxID=1853130 RepID=A0A191YWQ1_9PSED|nr:cysteine hydrolase family protein [Pseudomonas silesiensis]ANJ57203.1 isochorismatase [Pseudomonas silesiensis]VVO59757.1 Peroxyureidoacrylate/ureidoacrylate amidohydrolase RutB [Pseudomonas fluorescens]